MLAMLNLDQFCDASKLTPELAPLVSWVPGRDRDGREVQIAVYRKGTVFSGAMALQLCRTGQASPADEECAAEIGMTPEQLDVLRIDYEMNAKGINDKGDRELYRAGVIVGYNPDLSYKPGPNWDKYNAAKQQLQEGEL